MRNQRAPRTQPRDDDTGACVRFALVGTTKSFPRQKGKRCEKCPSICPFDELITQGKNSRLFACEPSDLGLDRDIT